ncbi:MAG: hypothetical protein JWM98_135, partial [Thermoleophilia bacterium]|nr:hypothetical protein [Thermoleophilia bacterium]
MDKIRADSAWKRAPIGNGDPGTVITHRGNTTVSKAEIVIALNTVWVLVAATLVLFMQAGFAL